MIGVAFVRPLSHILKKDRAARLKYLLMELALCPPSERSASVQVLSTLVSVKSSSPLGNRYQEMDQHS